MTLTTEQLRARAAAYRTDAATLAELGDTASYQRLNESANAFDELAANREAQPVALVDRRPSASGSICWHNGGKSLPHGTELYTAPPAPAVPNGFKLMPLEMTDEIGEAIAMEARCCGGIALCIYEAALAAAPGDENDHDTRR
ncbi:hypothetical protein P9A06_25635 [Serratia marcescens]|uniref:hypothetical protein n=1 Tax=Serratia marcescens TaxID=615 RepID=UPI003204E817